jgi:hypothetical protein
MKDFLSKKKVNVIKNLIYEYADKCEHMQGLDLKNSEFLLLRYHCDNFLLVSEERGVDNDWIYRALADKRLVKTCTNYRLDDSL